MRSKRLSALVCAALFFAGGRATAQPAPAAAPATAVPPLAETLDEASRREYEAAKALYAMGDSKGAFYKFQAAYELYADPRLLWNMATCAKNLHQYAEAVGLVRKYQKLGGGLLSEQDRKEAGEVERALASLTTSLVFRGDLAGVEITVDDKPVEQTGAPFVADLGPHRVTARKPGFREMTVSVSGRPLGEVVVPITLVRELHEATLVISARKGDSIYIDGRSVGVGSYRGKVSSGGHLVRVTAPSFRPFQQEISLRDDETRTVPVVLDADAASGGIPGWVWVAGGVVVTGVAVGIIVAASPGVDKTDGVPVGSISPGYVFSRF